MRKLICLLSTVHTIAWFVLVLSIGPMATYATPIFIETFDNGNLPGNQSVGPQFDTGLTVSANGSIAGWTESTTNGGTVHAVDLGANFAVMIWSGTTDSDIITLTSGIAANDLGTTYSVDFEVSPAVFMAGSQTTTASDALLIEILRADNSTLTSYNSSPGAWAGTMSFINDGFTYPGDGTGVVRLRISSANPGNNIFAGAIDNISVVPEPSTLSLTGFGFLALLAYRWRRRRGE